LAPAVSEPGCPSTWDVGGGSGNSAGSGNLWSGIPKPA